MNGNLNFLKESRIEELDSTQKNSEDLIDIKISYSVLSFILVLLFQFTVRILSNNRGGLISDLIKILAILTQGFIYLYSLKYVLKRNGLLFIFLYLIGGSIFLISFLFYPKNNLYIVDILFPFFGMALPAFLYTYSIKNYKNFYDIMEKIANLSLIFILILSIGLITGKFQNEEYSMGLSYYLLFPLLIYTKNFLQKTNLFDLIKVILDLMLILLMGARGTIVCFVVYSFLEILRLKDLKIRQIVLYLLILLAMIIFALNFREILIIIANLTYKILGMTSRTIELLLYDIGHDSGRHIIYETMKYSINNHPFLGIGIAGDRMLMENPGLYAHNIFLEIYVEFGLILGSFILLFILYLVFSSLLTKESKKYGIALLWICLGLLPLFFSGSYLTSLEFWIMLAVLLRLRKKDSYIDYEGE